MKALKLNDLGLALDTSPMEAVSVSALPETADGWQFEPKWDGFRCLAFRAGDEVEIKAKSGKSLSRFFPEVLDNLRALPHKAFVLDGELVITGAEGLSFDALQMRLHPAESRIRKLARETPATFIVFDCLLTEAGKPLLDRPLVKRREALERLFKKLAGARGVKLTTYTRDLDKAKAWLTGGPASLDGVIAKRLDQLYLAGERAMLKVKNLKTADCVVGGFRYESKRPMVGSLLLGLYDDAGLLHHVGFTSSISAEDRPTLTKRLEKLIAPPGFTGNAPGEPSRWSTERSADWKPLRPKLVVEVRYDHVTGDRFRHGTKLMRWRPDKAPKQCTFDQIRSAVKPDEVMAL
jgi:ATP-dependent DNA ligase